MIKPLPHQLDAIKAVIKEFKSADRCQIQMACGTGKTLTTLWIDEALKVKSTVVLLPSLALINQFMKEWLRNIKSNDYKTLVVCGDDTVVDGIEEESLLLDTIDYPVTQSAQEISEFLLTKSAKKIIFCTYHSSWLLEGLKFDLGIYDEAHKTAGIGKELWTFCLHDKNVQVAKRLFVTATPRHAVVTDKGEKSVYSMDDESVYGKRVYVLGFREAINLGLICDYDVIISAGDVNKHEFKGAYEIQEKALALLDAVQKTDAKKIVTYHANIKAAQDFAVYLKSSGLFEDYKISHVNGEMNIEIRQEQMSTFKHSKKAIITNSKCLTEGVDVPAIDMVAFLNPKSSKIDIVQAIGRALRKSTGKKVGYIFLPLFLDDKIEDDAQALEESEFKHIWEVLNAISEQDADLNDVIRVIRQGAGTAVQNTVWDEHVHLFLRGREFGRLRELITTKIVERLGRRWNDEALLAELTAFANKHGHCNIKRKDNPYLYRWLYHVKERYKIGKADMVLVEKIKALGFMFDQKRINPIEKWDKMYSEVCKVSKNMPKPFSISRIGEHGLLGRWCIDIREAYRKNRLPADKIELMNKIGFDWNPTATAWDQKYNELKEFIRQEKDFTQSLKNWIEHQREMFKQNKLAQEKIKLLQELRVTLQRTNNKRFSFADHPINNHPQYLSLMQYYKRHKTWTMASDNPLRNIVKHLRYRYKMKMLNHNSITLLNKYNFVWDAENQQYKKKA